MKFHNPTSCLDFVCDAIDDGSRLIKSDKHGVLGFESRDGRRWEIATSFLQGKLGEELTAVHDGLPDSHLEAPPFDMDRAAEELLSYLSRCGSTSECDIISDDHYKPFYRIATMFIAPSMPYRNEVLGGEVPKLEEAAEIMRRASPVLAKALDEDWESFEALYRSHQDAWE